MKAREAITRAHSEVVAVRSIITDGELQDGLRYLNRMMLKLKLQGVDVGYLSANNLDDDLTSNRLADLGIVKNLALNLWPQYRADAINPLIQFSAKRSLDSMKIIAIGDIQPAQYPSTMPIGSGNEDPPFDDKFYTNDVGVANYIAVEE